MYGEVLKLFSRYFSGTVATYCTRFYQEVIKQIEEEN